MERHRWDTSLTTDRLVYILECNLDRLVLADLGLACQGPFSVRVALADSK